MPKFKNRVGGSKLPAIEVTKPKGTSSGKEKNDTQKEEMQTISQGSKRLRDNEPRKEKSNKMEGKPGKKKREQSPDTAQI